MEVRDGDGHNVRGYNNHPGESTPAARNGARDDRKSAVLLGGDGERVWRCKRPAHGAHPGPGPNSSSHLLQAVAECTDDRPARAIERVIADEAAGVANVRRWHICEERATRTRVWFRPFNGHSSAAGPLRTLTDAVEKGLVIADEL